MPVPDNEALPFSTTRNGIEGEGRMGVNGFEKNAEERTSSSSSFRAGSFNAKSVRLVQWYPGHIARAERLLRDQLKNVDCVVEVQETGTIPEKGLEPGGSGQITLSDVLTFSSNDTGNCPLDKVSVYSD